MLAARYRAAGELNEVGGDFYDVFPRSETDWALVVGDVSGKGAEAAAITALARYTLRAAAMEEGAPSAALRRLNDAMLKDGSSQFATVVLAYISAGARRRPARPHGARRPPAAARRCARTGGSRRPATSASCSACSTTRPLHDAEFAPAPARPHAALHRRRHRGRPARRAARRSTGCTALLRGLAGRTPEQIVDAVEQAVVAAQPGEPRDDIALLALTVTAPQ